MITMLRIVWDDTLSKELTFRGSKARNPELNPEVGPSLLFSVTKERDISNM